MKLSELVDLKIRTKNYLSSIENSNFQRFLEEFDSWEDLPKTINAFKNLETDIKSVDECMHNAVQNFLDNIEQEIDNQSNRLLTYGYTVNGVTQLGPTATADEDLTHRKIDITPELTEQIGSRIRKYTDWKVPALEIGPGEGSWTDNLVGCDPLYLVDLHKEYLDKTILRYNNQFSRRIRPYVIGPENGKSHVDLSSLPPNQIGLIFSWAVFDYLFVNEIKIFLNSCYTVLRPGGVMVFSYNSADTVEGARLAETGSRTWVTKKILLNLLNEIGFEVIEFCNDREKVYHWIEIKKPGIMKSMKTSQPLYKINARPGFEKVDTESEIKYNQQQIARIKQLAIQLGIDTPEKIMGGAYSPHKLMKLVEVARMKK